MNGRRWTIQSVIRTHQTICLIKFICFFICESVHWSTKNLSDRSMVKIKKFGNMNSGTLITDLR